MSTVNIIGNEAYVKTCPIEKRWDWNVSIEQAERIASSVERDCINLRCVQGSYVEAEEGTIWFGDNLGRIAEGLSEGRIQLQPDENERVLAGVRTWSTILPRDAIGWKIVTVAYVYLGEHPSSQLLEQSADNPARTLFTASKVFPGQFVGLRDDLHLIIGDTEESVVKCIQGEEVNEL